VEEGTGGSVVGAIAQRSGFPTRLCDRGLFLDTDESTSLEQVWTLAVTRLIDITSTNSGTQECSERNKQLENRDRRSGRRGSS
jgi:hypothetical protein